MIDWNKLLGELSYQAPSGDVRFLKAEQKLRLLLDVNQLPYISVMTRYKVGNREREKYLVLSLDLETKEQNVWLIPKTVLRALLRFQVEGFGIWEANGHAVKITKSGTGLSTVYAVVPSPRPIPVQVEPTISLKAVAEQFAQTQRDDSEQIENEAVETEEEEDWG